MSALAASILVGEVDQGNLPKYKMLDKLPVELLRIIFSFIDGNELLRLQCLNESFHKFIKKEACILRKFSDITVVIRLDRRKFVSFGRFHDDFEVVLENCQRRQDFKIAGCSFFRSVGRYNGDPVILFKLGGWKSCLQGPAQRQFNVLLAHILQHFEPSFFVVKIEPHMFDLWIAVLQNASALVLLGSPRMLWNFNEIINCLLLFPNIRHLLLSNISFEIPMEFLLEKSVQSLWSVCIEQDPTKEEPILDVNDEFVIQAPWMALMLFCPLPLLTVTGVQARISQWACDTDREFILRVELSFAISLDSLLDAVPVEIQHFTENFAKLKRYDGEELAVKHSETSFHFSSNV